jgi:LysM repeat protein
MGRPALRFAVSLLFALVCVGLLAACSNDEATTTATPQLTAAEATAPPVRVLPTIRPAPPLPTNPPVPLRTVRPNLTTTYSVQSGDSWSSIAAKFGISMDALLIANNRNYTSSPLYAGETLTIPSSAFNPVFIPYRGNGGGPTQCRDGTYSHSSGRGTCSHHGGIR